MSTLNVGTLQSYYVYLSIASLIPVRVTRSSNTHSAKGPSLWSYDCSIRKYTKESIRTLSQNTIFVTASRLQDKIQQQISSRFLQTCIQGWFFLQKQQIEIVYIYWKNDSRKARTQYLVLCTFEQQATQAPRI